MNITEELITKAKTAASAEELIKMAAEEGITLTKEEAGKYLSFLTDGSELPDEALDAIAGGKGVPSAKFKDGQHIRFWFGNVYLTGKIKSHRYSDLQKAWYYVTKPDQGQEYCGESCDSKEWTLPLELSMYETRVIA